MKKHLFRIPAFSEFVVCPAIWPTGVVRIGLLLAIDVLHQFLLCVTTRAWLLQGVGVAHIIESNLHVLCWPLLNSRIIEQEHLLGLLLLDLPATLLFNLQFLLCMHACQQFN